MPRPPRRRCRWSPCNGLVSCESVPVGHNNLVRRVVEQVAGEVSGVSVRGRGICEASMQRAKADVRHKEPIGDFI